MSSCDFLDDKSKHIAALFGKCPLWSSGWKEVWRKQKLKVRSDEWDKLRGKKKRTDDCTDGTSDVRENYTAA